MRVWEAGVCVDYVDYSPPQLLSSSLKGINEQCAIQTNLDSKGFWLVFGKTIMPQVIYTSKKLFERTLFFQRGSPFTFNLSITNLRVMGQTANFYLLIPDPPRKLRVSGGSGGGRPIPNLHPKNAQKPLDVLANDTYIKHISFFFSFWFHM